MALSLGFAASTPYIAIGIILATTALTLAAVEIGSLASFFAIAIALPNLSFITVLASLAPIDTCAPKYLNSDTTLIFIPSAGHVTASSHLLKPTSPTDHTLQKSYFGGRATHKKKMHEITE